MMSKIGISALLAGFFIGIFSGISRFMQAENFWVDLTLSKLFGEERTESLITWFDTAAIQTGLDYLFYELPMFGLLLGIGVIFLLISLFIKNH